MNTSFEPVSFWTLDVNASEEGGLQPSTDERIDNILQIVAGSISLLLTYGSMFFMGCCVSWHQVKESLTYWKYLILGIFGQYLIMPLSGFLAIRMLNIEDYLAAGVTIVTCSPGGGFSNFLTYLCDGEVWLSIILTTVSSVLAFGIMPLNLWIYGGRGTFSVPYLQMFFALCLLNVALFIGMLIKWKIPRVAEILRKFGAVVMLLGLVSWFIIWSYRNPNFFGDAHWKLIVAVVWVMVTGMITVSVTARLCAFSASVNKTLVIETVYQSIGTALTVSIISFNSDVVMKVQSYMFFYGSVSPLIGLLFAGFFLLHKKIRGTQDTTILAKQEYSSVLTKDGDQENSSDLSERTK